ncbi:MAG TPA: hypothetical protein VM841_09955 [Actinomycetota bacterium]|nr:hypothetical protein [Actinomycetota bacterium]
MAILASVLPRGATAASSPWAPVSMTSYSAKLVCQQAGQGPVRLAGPWRVPDRRTLLWGAEFPYEFHGGLRGDNCALLLGPAAAVARSTMIDVPAHSGATPFKAFVECWHSVPRRSEENPMGTYNLFRRYPVPAAGVIVARFQIGQGDLCRISAGPDAAWPWYMFPGPMYGSYGGVGSPPSDFVARDVFKCMPDGSASHCLFRIRTTPHTRARFLWDSSFTGRLRMSERSGPWTRVTECDVLNGFEVHCAETVSPQRRPTGGITIVAGEAVARAWGTWTVGADSRPVWPA